MTEPLDEGDRQMLILALAWLALDRPGWNGALLKIAAKFQLPEQRADPVALFHAFKTLNKDHARPGSSVGGA